VVCMVLMAVAVGFAAYTLGHDAGRAQGETDGACPPLLRCNPVKVGDAHWRDGEEGEAAMRRL
ncbi:MAG TPA: hypothetical protein DC006_04880, partial [Prevotellaceae bacterium]|nr:hypothetical protein [Prevotellaceae bacterium]